MAPPAVIAEGFERQIRLRAEVDGQPVAWDERRLVIRSVRLAQAQERALRMRLDRAVTALLALNQRGRGRDPAELSPVCQQIVAQWDVEGLIEVQVTSEATERPVRRYGQRPARVIRVHQVTMQAKVNQAALTERFRIWAGGSIASTVSPGLV